MAATWWRQLSAFVLFVVVAVGLRRRWLRADLPALIEGVMPDDAFYYFEIARRVVAEGGVTFDGSTPATGFHPLWLALVAPFFRGAPPAALAPVHGTLWLATLLAVWAACAMTRVAFHLTGHFGLALALGLACASNLWMVRESLNGLETSLALALLATLLVAVVRYLEMPGLGRAVGVGLVAGLNILARSDMVLVVGPLVLLAAARAGLSRSFVALVAPPVVAVLGLTAFSLLLTGEPLQSSALATPLLVRSNWYRLHGHAATAGEVHAYGLALFRGTLASSREWLGEGMARLFVVSVLVALGALVLAWRRLATTTVHGALAVGAMIVGLVLLHLVHGYVRWFPRSWYFVAWVLAAGGAAAVAAAALLDLAGRRRRGPGVRAAAVALLALVAAVAAAELHRTAREVTLPRYGWQVELYEAGRGLGSIVPAAEPVGSFNAAIIGYVSDRIVVNLDGVVNEAAAGCLRQARLGRYMRDRGIRYLVDYPVMWSHELFRYAAGPLMGPEFARAGREVVARFDVPGMGWPDSTEAVELIRIDWRGAPESGPRGC